MEWKLEIADFIFSFALNLYYEAGKYNWCLQWKCDCDICFRADITIVCKAMEFGQFPLDSHSCYFLLTSCQFCTILEYTISTSFQSKMASHCFSFSAHRVRTIKTKSNRSAELLINTRGSFDVLYYKEGQTSTDISMLFSRI